MPNLWQPIHMQAPIVLVSLLKHLKKSFITNKGTYKNSGKGCEQSTKWVTLTFQKWVYFTMRQKWLLKNLKCCSRQMSYWSNRFQVFWQPAQQWNQEAVVESDKKQQVGFSCRPLLDSKGLLGVYWWGEAVFKARAGHVLPHQTSRKGFPRKSR